MTNGSVCKAYRDKESVFVKELERSIALREAEIVRAFQEAGSARLKLEALVRLYFGLSKGEDGKLSCLVVSGIEDVEHVGRAADILRLQLAHRRAMLARLTEEGGRDGSIAAGWNPQVLATVLLALFQGMRVVGKAEGLPGHADDFVAVVLRTPGLSMSPSILVTLLAGPLLPLQAAFNARLGRVLGLLIWTASVSGAVTTITLVPPRHRSPARPALHHSAAALVRWPWTEGLCGVVALLCMTASAPYLGAVAMIAAIVLI